MSFLDFPPADSISLKLPSRRLWIPGLVLGVFFAVFLAIAVGQILSMRGRAVRDVFDLMFLLFQIFWVLGWSVGVVFLGLLTALFVLYDESARLFNGRLVKVSRLGPVYFRSEYLLSKIKELRIEAVATAKSPDRVRIFFDYDGSRENLGDVLSRQKAEEIVSVIRSAPGERVLPEGIAERGWDLMGWAERGMARRLAPDSPSAPGTAPMPPPTWDSPSVLVLLAANALPLLVTLSGSWSLGQVMVLFWAETALIGFFNLLKLFKVSKFGALFSAPFFLGHFGGFLSVHFLFIYTLFVRGFEARGPDLPFAQALSGLFAPLWPVLAVYGVSHAVSFVVNFIGRREYASTTTQQLMKEPYRRVILMHVAILAAGAMALFLKNPEPAVPLLILVKTALDLRAHRKEHTA